MKQGGPSAGEGRHGVGGGPFLRVPATAPAAGEPGRLGTQGGRGHGASQSCSGGGSIGTPGCSAGGRARRPGRAGVAGGLGGAGGWCSHHASTPSATGVARMPARVAYMPTGPGSPLAHAGRPRRRRVARMVAEAGEDAGQLRQRHLRPGAGGEQAGDLADQPHQPAHHQDGADGDQQQGVVGLVVLELGAGQALALGPLRPHRHHLPACSASRAR